MTQRSSVARRNSPRSGRSSRGSRQGPCALVLSGEPGIGKTVLWETGVEEARRAPRVLIVPRGSEAEASLSFAGLSDLLAPVFDEVASSLLPPRRRALEIALLRVEPGADAARSTRRSGWPSSTSLSALAERGPVLVALDDLQWLDPASAGVIQIALRRLRRGAGAGSWRRCGRARNWPVRSSSIGRSPAGDRAADTRPAQPRCAVHRLLEERLGLELTRSELARVQEATAGNPFFALEVGRELVRTGTRPAPGQALPRTRRASASCSAAVSPGSRRDAGRVAAGRRARAAERRRRHRGPRRPGSRPARARGSRPRRGRHPGRLEIRFAHPLLASICYEEAPIWKRRAVHQALAGAVSRRRGAGTAPGARG